MQQHNNKSAQRLDVWPDVISAEGKMPVSRSRPWPIFFAFHLLWTIQNQSCKIRFSITILNTFSCSNFEITYWRVRTNASGRKKYGSEKWIYAPVLLRFRTNTTRNEKNLHFNISSRFSIHVYIYIFINIDSRDATGILLSNILKLPFLLCVVETSGILF